MAVNARQHDKVEHPASNFLPASSVVQLLVRGRALLLAASAVHKEWRRLGEPMRLKWICSWILLQRNKPDALSAPRTPSLKPNVAHGDTGVCGTCLDMLEGPCRGRLEPYRLISRLAGPGGNIRYLVAEEAWIVLTGDCLPSDGLACHRSSKGK
jgi:hypothetical protein